MLLEPATIRSRLRTPLAIGAVFVLALSLRLLSAPKAMEGGIRLLSPDCYGHLRRSAYVAENFPKVPFFDPYLNHPDGAVFIWPPFFDLVSGGAARLLFGPDPGLSGTLATIAAVPPFLGAFHPVLLFLAVLPLLGRRRAILAALLYALTPVAVIWSCFGHADHHVAEVLSLLAFLAAFVRAVLASGRRALFWAVIAAALLAGTLMTWQGAVFVVALAVPSALFMPPERAAVFGVAAAGFAGAGTWLALGGETVPFSFISFGWFQPLVVAGAAAALCLWSAWKGPPGTPRVLSLAAAALLVTILAPNVERLFGAVLRGGAFLAASQVGSGGDDFADGGYLSYPSDFLATVAEAKPLLDTPIETSAKRALSELNPGLLFLPVALVLWALPGVRQRAPRIRGRWVLVIFGLALLLMAFGQRRNVYYLAIFTAIALAEATARLEVRVPRFGRVAGALCAAGLVVGVGWGSLRRVSTYSEVPGRDLFWTIEALQKLDPPGRVPWKEPRPRPGEVPGVFCPWSMGHFVTALAQRPAAADPNTYGWRRQCRLYSSPTDEEARQILMSTKVRYLVTMNLRPILPEYARAAGRDESLRPEEMFAIRIHESESRTPVPFLELALDSRTAYRLRNGRLVPAYRIWRVTGPGAP